MGRALMIPGMVGKNIGRNDLMALTEEAAKISGIPYVMDAYREEAERVING